MVSVSQSFNLSFCDFHSTASGEKSPSNVHLHWDKTLARDPNSYLGPTQTAINLALMAHVQQVAKLLIPFKYKNQSVSGRAFRKLFTAYSTLLILGSFSSCSQRIKAQKANSLLHSLPLRTPQKEAKQVSQCHPDYLHSHSAKSTTSTNRTVFILIPGLQPSSF